jgi:hypothetical protein
VQVVRNALAQSLRGLVTALFALPNERLVEDVDISVNDYVLNSMFVFGQSGEQVHTAENELKIDQDCQKVAMSDRGATHILL